MTLPSEPPKLRLVVDQKNPPGDPEARQQRLEELESLERQAGFVVIGPYLQLLPEVGPACAEPTDEDEIPF